VAEQRQQWPHQRKTYLKPALGGVDAVGARRRERVDANDLGPWVCRRYERGRMLVTSHKALSAWAERLGDEVLAAAILDRLRHHAEVLPLTGPSSQLQDRLRFPRAGGMARTS
jgi:DNA replication protein DnaC